MDLDMTHFPSMASLALPWSNFCSNAVKWNIAFLIKSSEDNLKTSDSVVFFFFSRGNGIKVQ